MDEKRTKILIRISAPNGGASSVEDLLALLRSVRGAVAKSEEDLAKEILRSLNRYDEYSEQLSAGKYSFDREIKSARLLTIEDVRRGSWELLTCLPATPFAWRYIVKPIAQHILRATLQSDKLSGIDRVLADPGVRRFTGILEDLRKLEREAPKRLWGHILHRLRLIKNADVEESEEGTDRFATISRIVDNADAIGDQLDEDFENLKEIYGDD